MSVKVKRVKSTLILILITTIALSAVPALTQTLATVDVEPVGVKDFWGVMDVQEGQYIAIRVKIGVHYESPVSLDGFWLYVKLTKPNGEVVEKWFDYTGEYISKGSERTYTVKTGVLADQVGTWSVYVELWDKDKENRINYDSASFEVVKSLSPPGEVGYLIVGGLVVAGALIALRR